MTVCFIGGRFSVSDRFRLRAIVGSLLNNPLWNSEICARRLSSSSPVTDPCQRSLPLPWARIFRLSGGNSPIRPVASSRASTSPGWFTIGVPVMAIAAPSSGTSSHSDRTAAETLLLRFLMPWASSMMTLPGCGIQPLARAVARLPDEMMMISWSSGLSWRRVDGTGGHV